MRIQQYFWCRLLAGSDNGLLLALDETADTSLGISCSIRRCGRNPYYDGIGTHADLRTIVAVTAAGLLSLIEEQGAIRWQVESAVSRKPSAYG